MSEQQKIDLQLLSRLTAALAPPVAPAAASNVHYLAAPTCPVPQPDTLTPEEVALLRRLLPKLVQAAEGACPILAALD